MRHDVKDEDRDSISDVSNRVGRTITLRVVVTEQDVDPEPVPVVPGNPVLGDIVPGEHVLGQDPLHVVDPLPSDVVRRECVHEPLEFGNESHGLWSSWDYLILPR